MGNGRIDNREQSLLSKCHFIKDLLRDIDKLNHLMLTETSFNNLPADLNVLEGHEVPLMIFLHKLVNILLNVLLLIEDILQRISWIRLRLIPVRQLNSLSFDFCALSFDLRSAHITLDVQLEKARLHYFLLL